MLQITKSKFSVITAASILIPFSSFLIANESREAISVLQQVSPGNDGTRKALPAVAELKNGTGADLIPVLQAMKQATPIGKNYLAMVANSLYRKSGIALSTQLEKFAEDQSEDGEARYMVFQWLTAKDPKRRNEKLASMTSDPSLELRFAAIDLAIKEMDSISEPKAKMIRLEQLFKSSRQPMQVISLAKKLRDLGGQADTVQHFGFVSRWNLIGPFDNKDEKHFHTAYEIETDLLKGKFDLASSYVGKSEKVSWIEHTTDNQEGVVNLAELYKKEKGAIVYAYRTLDFDAAMDAELRLGTINANKVWWNSESVTANEVYHAAMEIDQYVGVIKIQPGMNQLVLKLCQNEQKEQWAQDWKFQIRICDSNGTAILPKK